MTADAHIQYTHTHTLMFVLTINKQAFPRFNKTLQITIVSATAIVSYTSRVY